MHRTNVTNLPPEQQALRDKCFHPTGRFLEFKAAALEQSIPQRFEQVVATYPERTAVKTKTQALSYQDLNRAANHVARAVLARLGNRSEPVPLLLTNAAWVAAATLGVLKTGKIYVPLDPSHPLPRLSYITTDIQAKLILTDNSTVSAATALAQGECALLNLEELDSSSASENLGLNISPDDLAYVRYTSGSTGEPKGVMEKHRNLLHVIMRQSNAFRICADDRLMFLGAWGKHIFRGLLNGAALYPVRIKEEGLVGLAQWLAEERVTIYHSIPSVFRHFVDTLNGTETFPDLRILRLAGEPLVAKDVELFKKHFSPKCLLVNELGSTEAGTIAHYLIDPGKRIAGDTVPVGYPDQDVKILLLDGGNSIGPDQIGEIAVKSRYLFPGYWGRPDLTNAAFLPDPAGGEERIYLTGDLGLMRADGSLVHLGRKDLQAKIRGNKVEPTEIEIALLRHRAIKEAAVITIGDGDSHQRLVAYVVVRTKSAPPVSELRGFLAAKLPEYMIPSAFVVLSALPVTPSGKLDRRALPNPDTSRLYPDAPFVVPSNPVENQLAQIWAKVLGLRSVGINDNFFDLGGHSLLMTRLLAQVAKSFAIDLPPRALVQAPTIKRLAEYINQGMAATPWSSLYPLQPNGSKSPFFWLHGEVSDAFLARYLGPDRPLYALIHQSDDGKPAHFTTVESIATHYLSEIKSVQPKGPYFLGGYCFGALVAIEIAQQLRKQNERVALLSLLEPTCIDNCKATPLRCPTAALESSGAEPSFHNFYHHLKQLATLSTRESLNYVASRLRGKLSEIFRPITNPVKRKVHETLCKLYLGLGWTLPRALRSPYILRVYHRATRAYELQFYRDRLILFLNHHSLIHSRTDWSKLASGPVEVHEVPGDHTRVLREPNLGVWAEQLRACLDQAESMALGAPVMFHDLTKTV